MTIRTDTWTWTVAAVVIALTSVRAAHAQTPSGASDVRLTLEEATERAVDRAPRLAEARAREAAARSTYDSRKAIALPSGTVSSSISRNNHVDEVLIPMPAGGSRVLYPDIPTNYRVRAEALFPVYAFGRVSATLDAARSDIDAASADVKTSDADVRLEASRVYWLLVTTGETVRVLEQSLARADAYVAEVRARVDAGVLPPNDLLSSQAQRAREYVRLVQARNDRAVVELELGRLVGEPAGIHIVATSPVDQVTSAAAAIISESPASLIAKALAGRPENAALLARSSSLRSSADAARANVKPYITGVAAVEPAKPNLRFVPPTDTWKTAWTTGFNLTWPLFDSGKSRAEGAALTAQAEAVDARRRDFEENVAVEVRQRLLDLESGRVALDASSEGVAAATEARRVVDERFRAGVATNTEVLDAQLALLEALMEQNRLQAALRLYEARLLRAVGNK